MIWVKNAIAYLLSLFLLLVIVVGVLATSITIALAHPAKLEGWLNRSDLYGHFVSTVITQAQKSTGSDDQSSGVSLSDSAVQQAANNAFSPALLQHDVDIFLNSNYAWLEGKTSTPEFTIDLSGAKQSFAVQVGQEVQIYLTNIPVCTTAQVANLQTTDPLALPCRPANLSPAVAAAAAQQNIATNGSFLSNPVITADNITSSQNNTHSEPYYKKLSFAPKAYRIAKTSPLLFGLLAVVSASAIILLSRTRRKGFSRVGTVFIISGGMLIATKLIADALFKKFEGKIFNNSGVGQLQQSLTDFVHRAESQIVNVNFYCGLSLVAVAIIIFIILAGTHHHKSKPKAVTQAEPTEQSPQLPMAKPLSFETPPVPAPRPMRPMNDISGINPVKPAAPVVLPPGPISSSARKKRPRLIQ